MATEQNEMHDHSESAYDTYGRRKRPRPGSSRRVPFGRFILFYLSLVAIATVLSWYIPVFHDAWLASDFSQVQSQGGNILEAQRGIELDPNPAHRALMTLLITLGALAISLPVVVAGIVLIVKNSVALAFSLAGIVAGVRFRNTLKDPKDAVYIFLALSIGLAAGVRASDVALVSSLIFNLVILIVWKYNLASVYAGDSKGPLFTIGDTTLLLANRSEQRAQLRERLKAEAGDIEADGFLLVHTDDVSAAMRGAELSVAKVAKEWKVVPKIRQRYEITTFAVLIELDGKKGNPLHLLAELDE